MALSGTASAGSLIPWEGTEARTLVWCGFGAEPSYSGLAPLLCAWTARRRAAGASERSTTHSPPDGGGITPHRVPRRSPAELSRSTTRCMCTLASGPQPRPRNRLTHRREIAGRIALVRQDAWVVLFQEAPVLRGEPLCHRVQVVHVPPLRRNGDLLPWRVWAHREDRPPRSPSGWCRAGDCA